MDNFHRNSCMHPIVYLFKIVAKWILRKNGVIFYFREQKAAQYYFLIAQLTWEASRNY